MQITKNISYNEVIKSNIAIRSELSNNPDERQIGVITHMAKNLIQPLRDKMGVPFYFSSIFRSKEVNKKAKGSSRSHHMVLGDTAAFDIDDVFCKKLGISNREIFLEIYNNWNFVQLIWEYEGESTKDGKRSPAWVHVSYSTKESKNKRKEVLFYSKKHGKQSFNFNLI